MKNYTIYSTLLIGYLLSSCTGPEDAFDVFNDLMSDNIVFDIQRKGLSGNTTIWMDFKGDEIIIERPAGNPYETYSISNLRAHGDHTADTKYVTIIGDAKSDLGYTGTLNFKIKDKRQVYKGSGIYEEQTDSTIYVYVWDGSGKSNYHLHFDATFYPLAFAKIQQLLLNPEYDLSSEASKEHEQQIATDSIEDSQDNYDSIVVDDPYMAAKSSQFFVVKVDSIPVYIDPYYAKGMIPGISVPIARSEFGDNLAGIAYKEMVGATGFEVFEEGAFISLIFNDSLRGFIEKSQLDSVESPDNPSEEFGILGF